MTTYNRKNATPDRRGFTLVEVMVAVTLLGLILASVLATFTVFAKSVAGLGNYATMSRDSRGGLEVISRDLHVADSLTLATENEMTMVLPADAGGGTVNYKYDSQKGSFTRTAVDSSGTETKRELFDDVAKFSLIYYNRLGGDALAYNLGSLLSETKSVQLNAKLVKAVVTTDTTDYIISARFLMRNK